MRDRQAEPALPPQQASRKKNRMIFTKEEIEKDRRDATERQSQLQLQANLDLQKRNRDTARASTPKQAPKETTRAGLFKKGELDSLKAQLRTAHDKELAAMATLSALSRPAIAPPVRVDSKDAGYGKYLKDLVAFYGTEKPDRPSRGQKDPNYQDYTDRLTAYNRYNKSKAANLYVEETAPTATYPASGAGAGAAPATAETSAQRRDKQQAAVAAEVERQRLAQVEEILAKIRADGRAYPNLGENRVLKTLGYKK